MRIRHRDHEPQVDPTAYVAPTAVLSGDVRIGAGSRILFGAVLTAEGGTITIGENVVVMEHAVLRSTARDNVTIGDNCIVGPRSYIVGADIHDEVFIATGSSVFNGAVISAQSEVRINGTVHLRSVLPAGSMVPIGWIAVGNPAQVFSPAQHDELWPLQAEQDFPGYVFGVDRSSPTAMIEITERWSRSLSMHLDDEVL
jgi:carbonic anhydrase/acetyltransferase-like protein (isoleucine patch superfamily)